MNNQLIGVVTRYDVVKGYGFVAVEGRAHDYFVHASFIDLDAKICCLLKDERVQFVASHSLRGPQARRVKPIAVMSERRLSWLRANQHEIAKHRIGANRRALAVVEDTISELNDADRREALAAFQHAYRASVSAFEFVVDGTVVRVSTEDIESTREHIAAVVREAVAAGREQREQEIEARLGSLRKQLDEAKRSSKYTREFKTPFGTLIEKHEGTPDDVKPLPAGLWVGIGVGLLAIAAGAAYYTTRGDGADRDK